LLGVLYSLNWWISADFSVGNHPNKSPKNMSTIISMNREKLLEELKFPFCDDVNKYEILAKIGQGTFGEVFKARHKENKIIVAIKTVLVINEKEGVSANTVIMLAKHLG
jgi:serine/threonine protein kinase